MPTENDTEEENDTDTEEENDTEEEDNWWRTLGTDHESPNAPVKEK